MKPEPPVIYLDNASTTFPKPEAVYREMDSFYRNYGGNAGRGSNPLARRAANLVQETRELLKLWLNAPEIVFSPSDTIALNTVLFGARFRAGDVVYVSPFEHNSMARPLEHLRKTVGIVIRQLPYGRQTMSCKLDEVKTLFRLEPPTMLCVSQVSNVFGVISPVEELAALARQASPSVIVLVDGAQAAGLIPLDLSHIDAFVFSGHKSLYGPYGVAGIAFGRNWRPAPFIYGGTGTQSESIEMPQNGPSRFEAGSQNISAIAGLNAALCWLQEVGRDAINRHIGTLIENLYHQLSQIPDVTLYIPSNSALHTGIVSLNVGGISPQAIENALGSQNIAVRAGLHCAPWAHSFLSTVKQGGTVRISCSYFNTDSEIQSLVEAIQSLISTSITL